jgi:hypothetical protein
MTRDSEHHDGDAVRRRRTGGATATSLAVLMLAACGPDAKGKFEEYIDEAEELAPKMDLPEVKEDIPPPDPGIDLSGTSLLALSTVIAPDLPLQFLNTVVQRNEGERIFLDITLQPLSLDSGSVTMPRLPVGEPLTFKDVEVVDGKYMVDAGETMVTGAANPITGSDIVATLMLSGQVIREDFVCGTVAGMVTSPLEAPIDGSTFGAVKLEDPSVLPLEVVINCAEDTRTDG